MNKESIAKSLQNDLNILQNKSRLRLQASNVDVCDILGNLLFCVLKIQKVDPDNLRSKLFNTNEVNNIPVHSF